ncbi:MAG: glutamine synthetase family protein [Clostridia bacterium]|nr:glutamine synthetase family protein [Clostridia bacterium]
MVLSNYEVLQFVKENDVKFVRLAFCDLLGRQRNIAIMADGLENVLRNGMQFDASAVDFCEAGGQDLKLFPDVTTLHMMPWRPQHGRVVKFLCSLKKTNNSTSPLDAREVLKDVLNQLNEEGIETKVGTECEFYLFKTDENGEPTSNVHDNASYFDIAPLDKGENVRREICLCLEEMSINPLSSHHEKGPGQNEIDFIDSDALTACDNFLIFKTVVKAIAARNGLFASFMPKPIDDKSGNSLAINFKLKKEGKDIFGNFIDAPTLLAEGFVAGILKRANALSIFLNPDANSYSRLGRCGAPSRANFSFTDRSSYIRLQTNIDGCSRLEMHSSDPAVNPYLAIALVLKAGLLGMKKGEKLSNVEIGDALPNSIENAIEIAICDDFLRDTLGDKIFEQYIKLKKNEVKEFALDPQGKSRKYFEVM